MAAFPNAISDTIAIITNLKTNKGLFLVDENFVNARKIFKYLLTLFGTKRTRVLLLLKLTIYIHFITIIQKMLI